MLDLKTKNSLLSRTCLFQTDFSLLSSMYRNILYVVTTQTLCKNHFTFLEKLSVNNQLPKCITCCTTVVDLCSEEISDNYRPNNVSKKILSGQGEKVSNLFLIFFSHIKTFKNSLKCCTM